ncbi:TadE/TadG family type IV pilus assembly protein [Hyphococcus sp. DH-69]|uniref:TadE/TadG family type IV pilus assembly protein n=1 Tax=Hyphococcus formosus TaxID=3143534 RepID=UPI00398BAF49
MRPSIFRGWVKNRSGSTAVEFAMIMPLFLAILFSIFEAGWFYFVSTSVQQANANAARLIRTGQAQSGALSKDAFFKEICDVVDAFGSCEEKLTIDIAKYDNFAQLAADVSEPVCRDKDDPTIEGAQFGSNDYGHGEEIIRVRVCFLYKPMTPALGLNLAKTKHGDRKLVSVSIFRNEPFASL